MLLDQTVFTIGPNASMVIDKFVYNPKSPSRGTLQARILKGTFRFVSGKIAHKNPNGVKLKLKVATLSIRGTNVIGQTGGKADVVILSGTGNNNNGGSPTSAIQISAGGFKVVITSTGYGAIIFDNGSGPVTQYFSGAAFAAILAALGIQPPPPPGGGGGNAQPVDITTAIIISFTGQGIGAGILTIRIGGQVFTFTTTAQPPTVLPPHIPPPAVTPPSGSGYPYCMPTC